MRVKGSKSRCLTARKIKKASKPVARNVMESGFMEKSFQVRIRLTEPQGIIKYWLQRTVARNGMEGGSTG